MQVTNHQIEKVLNVYTRKLGRGRETENEERLTRNLSDDRISLSSEGKRRAVLERVSADILDKLAQEGASTRVDLPEQAAHRRPLTGLDPKKNAFVFNVIGDDQQKATTAISLLDADAFMRLTDTDR